jgi:hypothetical protein
VTQYYADYNSDNRVDALGYKESQYDKSFRGFNWDAAYRFSKGLTVSVALLLLLQGSFKPLV